MMQLQQRPQLSPEGDLELGWPLEAVSNQSKGVKICTPELTCHGIRLPLEKAHNLGKTTPFGRGQF